MSSPSEAADAPQEHAVLLEWADGQPPLEFIFAVEDRLKAVIDTQPGLGEVDGNEVGSGTAVIYLYGRTAKRYGVRSNPWFVRCQQRETPRMEGNVHLAQATVIPDYHQIYFSAGQTR
ncbi:hypothetical protein [Mycolicibacterium houstonense]|uniref:hypothetical protein n=1 Tax=Mycolicibacterium houstonense TaxID=146021 RepID=UPI003F9B2542